MAPQTWVFWIHASSTARFEEDYQQIASVGNIPGREDGRENILQLVYQWLCDERNGRWLMVVDNADDQSVFLPPNGSNEKTPLAKLLPQVAHGHILLTSRNRMAARKLLPNDGHVIDIHPMNEKESLNLLRMRNPGQPLGNDERALVEELEYLPLAIMQAGSFIANRSPKITVVEYLKLFRDSESNQTNLLNYEDAQGLRQDPSTPQAVLTTWQLSFQQIRKQYPTAVELLALMSMFDRHAIPENLIRGDKDIFQFGDALSPLVSFSLVRETEQRSFEMHRLVQLSVRTWLQVHRELDKWRKRSRQIMAQVFPDGEFCTWDMCQKLLPHSKEVMKHAPVSSSDQLNVSVIASDCGWYLTQRGCYKEAKELLQRALEARGEILGYDHPDSLDIIDSIGVVLLRQGKPAEAEAIHRRALEGYKKVLGHDDPRTLYSVSQLGSTLVSQEKYEEAEAIHRWALEKCENLFGCEDERTLTFAYTLGCIVAEQGRHEEGEELLLENFLETESLFGLDHLETLSSLDELAWLYQEQRKYQEAEAIQRRVLELEEKMLGQEHPRTLMSLIKVGMVLSAQKKYAEAEALHRQALERQEKVLGDDHPETLNTVNNLGYLSRRQGRYEEAEHWYRRAVSGYQKVLGCEHPETLKCMLDLGEVFQARKRHDQRKELGGRNLQSGERSVSELRAPPSPASI